MSPKQRNIIFTSAVLAWQLIDAFWGYVQFEAFYETIEVKELYCGYYNGFYLLNFMLVIIAFEYFIENKFLKILSRTLLILITITQLLETVFNKFYLDDAIFNTAWFSAVLAIFISAYVILKPFVLKAINYFKAES